MIQVRWSYSEVSVVELERTKLQSITSLLTTGQTCKSQLVKSNHAQEVVIQQLYIKATCMYLVERTMIQKSLTTSGHLTSQTRNGYRSQQEEVLHMREVVTHQLSLMTRSSSLVESGTWQRSWMTYIYILSPRTNGWPYMTQLILRYVVPKREAWTNVENHLQVPYVVDLTHQSSRPTSWWIVRWLSRWGVPISPNPKHLATRSETKASLSAIWMCLPSCRRRSHSTTTGKSSSTHQHQWQCRTPSSSKTTTPPTSMCIISRWRREEWTWVEEWEIPRIRPCPRRWRNQVKSHSSATWRERDHQQEMVTLELYSRITWSSLEVIDITCHSTTLTYWTCRTKCNA